MDRLNGLLFFDYAEIRILLKRQTHAVIQVESPPGNAKERAFRSYLQAGSGGRGKSNGPWPGTNQQN